MIVSEVDQIKGPPDLQTQLLDHFLGGYFAVYYLLEEKCMSRHYLAPGRFFSSPDSSGHVLERVSEYP